MSYSSQTKQNIKQEAKGLIHGIKLYKDIQMRNLKHTRGTISISYKKSYTKSMHNLESTRSMFKVLQLLYHIIWHAKFQSDAIILTQNLTDSKPHQILQ